MQMDEIQGKFRCGVTAIIRITLKDGTFHEVSPSTKTRTSATAAQRTKLRAKLLPRLRRKLCPMAGSELFAYLAMRSATALQTSSTCNDWVESDLTPL